MRQILLIAVAGALGAVSRYGVGLGTSRWFGGQFPLGTLVVNVLGCFVIGLVMHLGITAKVVPMTAVTAVTVGFLGAFTTFSALGYQTFELLDNYEYFAAAANIAANVVLGLFAVWGGLAVARLALGSA